MRTKRTMRAVITVGVSTLFICGASGTAGAAPEGTGIEVGARLGFGIPLGGVDGNNGDDLNKTIGNMVPIWLDAGYRVIPNLYVGAFFMYGFGSLGSQASMLCNQPGAGCSVHDTRFGANAQYHITIPGPLEPWIGAGLGFEWLGGSASVNNASGGFGTSGFEFFNLQAGIDYKAMSNLGIGPFLALTFAQYDNQSQDGQLFVPNGGSASMGINNKALHEWLIFGVRGTFVIPLP
ncbi:MAG: hypothetical protein JOZ69_11200 [Myxococcales bacterium]|nr:hypothetical protein [Myxococcales bacterium]